MREVRSKHLLVFLYRVVFNDPEVLKYVRVSRNGSAFIEESISSCIE